MAGNRLVSMKDVARRAEVSVGTVSNVLNRPDIVSQDRRERVEAAIAELGYVRNDAARQLKLGHSRTVGAIVLDSANPFYGQIVGGIESAAESSSLAVIAGSTGNREQRERLYLSLFEEQRVRGILLASTGGTKELIDGIRRRGTPVVLVESSRDATGGSSVSVDDIAGGEIAVRHLAELGRRRIGVVAARQDLRQVADRLHGARRAAADAGIELEVLDAEDLTVLAGRAAGMSIVERPAAERPDAVFCVNDLIAVGVLQAFAFRHQISVPEEIALVGYDDIAFASSTVVPLTSVAQPADLMGRTALALLEEEIADPDASPRHVSFTPTLVERESTTG
ncbi:MULTISPECIES: LacI family DNA-binding transcriptional regulator [Brachybacterium]|uniref:LacI family transcriptional regulator n=2 Tax=Brachybacterium alimentarium TaxID=47845 RepID=A0A2A3YJJ4_9MICO|nr:MULTISPECIES: LacI family DNA-binding transcriptional regulator [Brachybacterium]PCC33544.1 LacI family transcriptional regulator [Brachybacterium alimentarium]PCC39451.1 LacI family transcriptional regulator [Brachybacterium alimentarium]RCS63542.1 LacI family transcriptional regulator [Brachybacterium alimentarium]RCS66406.1 LacI family transcriptional regulator [Brachybacterium sp. JB7]RCS77252.1 LacI family transcriptional regulator [Brachybacterium alimentarium]